MNEEFRKHVEALEPAYRCLLGMDAVAIPSLPKGMPRAGVYLFSERGQPLYVGRSNRLRSRLQEHGRASSKQNSAPFAFRLAREVTGQTAASYTTKGSRTALEQDPAFGSVFSQAKQRIREMEVRFVEEADPLRQGLLEVYVALAVGAKYNDFDTH
jgi:predicted GIY-YIG superfamily endonuclease